MADTPTGTSLVSSDLRDQMLDALVESIAIGSGHGSANSRSETILSKYDRYALSPVELNQDMVGLTFFTRPRLNLTTESLRQDRLLAMMDTMDPTNIMFGVRCNLDSVFSQSTVARDLASLCPWFNDESPFNLPLGNLISSISGWPDYSVEYETTESGYFSEDMTMVRGSDQGRRTYDLSCTFRDHRGGYIMCYFYYWLYAMALQMEGTIVAYSDDREANRLNYTCSIYRFTLDRYQRTITKWAKATGCFPVSVPLGDVFNYGPGDTVAHTSQQFTIPFKANNVKYMDPIHLQAFNTLVQRYLGSDPTAKGSGRVKTGNTAEANFTGVPWIELINGTNELQWWAEPEELVNPATQTIQNIENTIAAQVKKLATSTNPPSTDVGSSQASNSSLLSYPSSPLTFT